MSRRRSPVIWLALLAVVVAGVWYWRSPRRAWDRFNRALITGRESELQSAIDFPILRDNLKADLRTAISDRSRNPDNLLVGLTGGLLDQMVNAALTPQSLSQMISGFGMRQARPDEGGGMIQAARLKYRYRSPSRVDVEVRPEGGEAAAGGIFTFERSGLSWRLVRIWSERLTASGDS